MDEGKRRLDENKRQGRWGELYGNDQLIIKGYEIEKTGKGSDVHAVKKDIHGNIVEDELIDHKTGNAELSKKQREAGAKKNQVWLPPFARKFKPPF